MIKGKSQQLVMLYTIIGYLKEKMEIGNSYVYFALTGEDFDTDELTTKLGFTPTQSWRKGDKGKYKPVLEFANWELSTDKSKECIYIDN